jgi:hypothetical protein
MAIYDTVARAVTSRRKARRRLGVLTVPHTAVSGTSGPNTSKSLTGRAGGSPRM